MNREDEYTIARARFNDWIKYTQPMICDKGRTIVWRGRAWGEIGGYHPWYRIAIYRFLGELGDPLIEIDCDNPKMLEWMQDQEAFFLETLGLYCKAVWDLIDCGIVLAGTFNWQEDEVEFDEDIEEWEAMREESQNNAADAVNITAKCEQKYGFDYT